MLARPSSYGYTGEEHGARQINNNGVKMRKYLKTTKPLKVGDKFFIGEQEYQRTQVGGALFDLKVAGPIQVQEFKDDWKLWKTDKKAYYDKFGN